MSPGMCGAVTRNSISSTRERPLYAKDWSLLPAWQWEALLYQVIAVSYVFIAPEAEEVIQDATAGWRDLNLFEIGSHITN